MELPSAISALRRLGVTGDFYRRHYDPPRVEWDNFTRRQFYRAGVVSIPYAAARGVGYEFRGYETREAALAPAVWGAAAACAALAALALARGRRLPMASAILFGFCWAFLARYNTYSQNHAYEAVHFVWLALALFGLALVGARRLLGGRAAIAAAAIAAPIFALSVFYAGQATEGDREAARQRTEMADFDVIREMTRGETVGVFPVHTARRSLTDYYMAGSYRKALRERACEPDAEGFLVSAYRFDIPNLLTPDNRLAFLYEDVSPLELCRAKRRRLESSEPAARSVFDVYLRDGYVDYLKAPCDLREDGAPFYVYAHPVDRGDMPARFKGGDIQVIPDFDHRVMTFDGACLMTLAIPAYPIAAVQTGQWIHGVERLWEVFANPPLGAEARAFYEDAYQAIIASGEPAARSEFDLYLDGDGGALSYLREPCDEYDARGRFFLSVHPADVEDLPEDRRELKHESLNFTFAPPFGVIFDGKCMATRQLPDYPIARIETGQWIPGGDELWKAEVVVGD